MLSSTRSTRSVVPVERLERVADHREPLEEMPRPVGLQHDPGKTTGAASFTVKMLRVIVSPPKENSSENAGAAVMLVRSTR